MTRPFGTTHNGQSVAAIDIRSPQLSARILTLGAILSDVRLAGLDRPLTLGSPDLAAYEGPLVSFGSIMGPVVNRIKGAQAQIAGRLHRFEATTKSGATLHSGATGIQSQVWTVAEVTSDAVTLTLCLPDGLGGFPGQREITATYRVSGATLTLQINATSDAATLWNIANHAYWALDDCVGFGGHQLQVLANSYLQAGEDLLPTGVLAPLAGSDVDLRKPLSLSGDAQQFFDFNFCTSTARVPLRDVAVLRSASGLTMTMASTECGLQVYDGGTIDGAGFATHHGPAYAPYDGIALEAQSWPGATDNPAFPSIEYAPGQPYAQTTSWRFSDG